MPRRVAVLDANVLFPFQLRNLLLHLAVQDLYEPLWSDEILEECMRNLRSDAGMTKPQCEYLVGQMRAYFPDAWGTEYAGAADPLPLPDERDRHVVALSLRYEAEFVVTRNVKHFPRSVLRPLGTEAIHPDRFLEELWRQDSPAVLRGAEQHRCSLQRRPFTPSEYLSSLRQRAELPRTAQLLLEGGFLDARPQVG